MPEQMGIISAAWTSGFEAHAASHCAGIDFLGVVENKKLVLRPRVGGRLSL